jgi:hypothetical protein
MGLMRKRLLGMALLLAGWFHPATNQAAEPDTGSFRSFLSELQPKEYKARGQLGDVPGNPSTLLPLPLGHDRMETGGFFFSTEMWYLSQNKQVGNQVVSVRGLVDSSGYIQSSQQGNTFSIVDTAGALITIITLPGAPGARLGSGAVALSTGQLGKTSFQPGIQFTLGYKLDSGVSVTYSHLQLMSNKLVASASGVPPFFNGGADQADYYLFSGVYNFPTQFSGPQYKTAFDASIPDERGFINGNNTYGIWNAASLMDISLTRRTTFDDITARIPVVDTEYSRAYALAGAKAAWFWEQFRWRTVSLDNDGDSNDLDAATYRNTLSQRLYGPMLGCGYEVYLGQGFALSADFTGSLLVNFSKMSAKYERDDERIQNKRTRNEFSIVPNANAGINLWWYPVPYIQMRVGYNVMGYFNTTYMDSPIDFNYGGLDPGYDKQFMRFLHGANAGIGFIF